jgi:hypothetical protein
MGGSDGCWFDGSKYAPFMAVTGGTWSVGSFGYNTTGYDYIGFVDPAYYQSERPGRGLSIPCASTIHQSMLIQCTTVSADQLYKSNAIQATIGSTYLNETRDGATPGNKVFP